MKKIKSAFFTFSARYFFERQVRTKQNNKEKNRRYVTYNMDLVAGGWPLFGASVGWIKIFFVIQYILKVILGTIWTLSLVAGLCSEQVLDGSKSETCSIARDLRLGNLYFFNRL